MSVILKFPPRGRDIHVEREWNDFGWLVLLPDRSHGWLHGSFHAAILDAREIATGFGTCVVSSAGKIGPW